MGKVYGDIKSGNCYKVRLLLELLGEPYFWKHVDILAGETRTAAFLKMNPEGAIPVMEVLPGEFLVESNAILHFLGEGTPWLPARGMARAKVLQWQFFEQHNHEPFLGKARFIKVFLGLPEEMETEFKNKYEGGRKALEVMEAHLSQQRFFPGDSPSIADISLYAYTHLAHEAGQDLGDFPQVRRWCEEIAQLPGYIDIADKGRFGHYLDDET